MQRRDRLSGANDVPAVPDSCRQTLLLNGRRLAEAQPGQRSPDFRIQVEGVPGTDIHPGVVQLSLPRSFLRNRTSFLRGCAKILCNRITILWRCVFPTFSLQLAQLPVLLSPGPEQGSALYLLALLVVEGLLPTAGLSRLCAGISLSPFFYGSEGVCCPSFADCRFQLRVLLLQLCQLNLQLGDPVAGNSLCRLFRLLPNLVGLLLFCCTCMNTIYQGSKGKATLCFNAQSCELADVETMGSASGLCQHSLLKAILVNKATSPGCIVPGVSDPGGCFLLEALFFAGGSSFETMGASISSV